LPERETFLVADIGGTNARIAVGRTGVLGPVETLANAEPDAVLAALKRAATDLSAPRRAVFAVAGPVDDGRVRFTNRALTFSRLELMRALGLDDLLLVNDFVALAHAVPALQESERAPVGGDAASASGNILVCGPGTGFGAAVLLPRDDGHSSIATEAGHMILGPAGTEEAALFAHLAADKPLAVEDVLSGRGLAALHAARGFDALSSKQVIARAEAGDAACGETVDVFLRVFGRVAGDLALAFDSRGGVYVAGGVGLALRAHFARPAFRDAFEAHPPFEARLAAIPRFVILHPFPGLLGAVEMGAERRKAARESARG
jgi:glucokinase